MVQIIDKFAIRMHESWLYNPTAKYKVIYSLLIILPMIPEFLLSFQFSVPVVFIPT